jgi:hypothetical protein
MYNKPTSIVVATVAEAKAEITIRLNNQPNLFFASCNARCECGDTEGLRGHDGCIEIKVAICDVCANA